ncbi:hypothetical protein Bhyg_04132, partial [Pseudolycoriella hygida]
ETQFRSTSGIILDLDDGTYLNTQVISQVIGVKTVNNLYWGQTLNEDLHSSIESSNGPKEAFEPNETQFRSTSGIILDLDDGTYLNTQVISQVIGVKTVNNLYWGQTLNELCALLDHNSNSFIGNEVGGYELEKFKVSDFAAPIPNIPGGVIPPGDVKLNA